MAWIDSFPINAGSVLLAALIGIVAWYRWLTRSRRPPESGYEYVLVNDDGSAREVTSNEREYFETEFSPGDGARPYIKFRYESVDGRRSIGGFLLRRQLPAGIPIREPTEQEKLLPGG